MFNVTVIFARIVQYFIHFQSMLKPSTVNTEIIIIAVTNHRCVVDISSSWDGTIITTTFAIGAASGHLDLDGLFWVVSSNSFTGIITARAFAFGTTRFHCNACLDRMSIHHSCSHETILVGVSTSTVSATLPRSFWSHWWNFLYFN